MDKKQMLVTLASLYRTALDDAYCLLDESIRLDKAGEEQARRKLSRQAAKKYSFSEGVKAAANALGISDGELVMAAITLEMK